MEKEEMTALCAAGGVFLNVKLNQRLWYSGKITRHWTYPNTGDSGLAVGSALYAHYERATDDPIVCKSICTGGRSIPMKR